MIKVIDKEKVVLGLQYCTTRIYGQKCPEACPYYEDGVSCGRILMETEAAILLKNKSKNDYAEAYNKGYDDGRQQLLKEILKMFGRSEWYGGDKQKERAAGVPGTDAGRAAAQQQGLQRAGASGQDGRIVGAGEAEG